MRNNMSDKDVVEFDEFLERNWGIKPPKMPELEEDSNEIEKKPEPVFKTLKQELAEKGMAPSSGGNINMGQNPAANVQQNPMANQQPNAMPNQQQVPNNPAQNMRNPGVGQVPNNPFMNNQQAPAQPNVQSNMGGVNQNANPTNINQLGVQNPNNNNPTQQGSVGNNSTK
jgi:hypothetical protein